MNSNLTIADARRLIGDLFNAEDFVGLLNRASERVINSGLWKGAISYAAFPTVTNYFTLPYQFLSVIGAQWFRCPVPVFGQFHDFVIGGPGQPLSGFPPQGIVEDLGDGYPTQSDIPTDASTLRITISNSADAGKIFRLFGEDANDRQIFDSHGMGLNLTTINSSADTTQTFNAITGVQAPVNGDGSSAMIGSWTLSSVSGATVTELGYYYPNEARPSYRRYRIGVTSSTNTQVPNAVTVLVRKRFLPVYKETDPLLIDNIGALTFGMQAIDSENAKNPAQPLWDQCFAILNQELHATRGAARPEAAYETLGSMAGFGNVW